MKASPRLLAGLPIVRESLAHMAQHGPTDYRRRSAAAVLAQLAEDKTDVNDADDASAILAQGVADPLKEHFLVLTLNAKNQRLGLHTVHVGTLTMSVVGPREVFRLAISDGASSIILGHNHPSGDPTPSPEDVEVTGKLAKIGDSLDIVIHDHIILGGGRFFSMRKHKLL